MQLTYDEIKDALELKYFPTKRTRYSSKPNICQKRVIKKILPDKVKMNVTIDEQVLKSNLKINQTSIFTDESFFYTTLGFT